MEKFKAGWFAWALAAAIAASNPGEVKDTVKIAFIHQTLAVADYGYVLAQGRIVAEGVPNVLRENDEVQRAYFGHV